MNSPSSHYAFLERLSSRKESHDLTEPTPSDEHKKDSLNPVRTPKTNSFIKQEIPMSVLLEFSMSPLDKGPSVGAYVSRSLDIIDKSGVSYQLNPMGTVLEGEWDEVMSVVRDCYLRMSQDCERISVAIKVDARSGQTGRIAGKVASVEKHLGRPVKHI